MTFSLRYDADLQRLELECEPASHDEVSEATSSFLAALITVLEHPAPTAVDADSPKLLERVEEPEHLRPGFTA